MVSKIKSCAMNGLKTEIIHVECDVSRGMPMLNIVGLPDAEVKESKERIRAAVNNSGLTFPTSKRITVNLSPAGTKKEGTHLDLAMALSLLISAGDIYNERTDDMVVLGELSLDGRVNSAGAAASMLMGLRGKTAAAVIPYDDLKEAILIEGIDIYPVRTLAEAYGFICGTLTINKMIGKRPEEGSKQALYEEDFSEVRGREEAKRAVEICVSGFHHMLMSGPPGCGKSMIAKRIPTVMPEMEYEEMLEVMGLYSISGAGKCSTGNSCRRPFRTPVSNISLSAMIGGGAGTPKPGEVSLAHNGVLFLDEMPEFRRDVLESLRQPLEDESVSISRTAGKITYPCKFILVGAKNPCPCGYLNDPLNSCSCTAIQIKRYSEKISGPIMDRFDLFVDMMPEEDSSYGSLLRKDAVGKDSQSMKKSIEKARRIQKERYRKDDFKYNSQLKGKALQKYCSLYGESMEMYEMGCSALKVSKRGEEKILRVARTIADIEGSEEIQSCHLAEAFQFRSRDGSYI